MSRLYGPRHELDSMGARARYASALSRLGLSSQQHHQLARAVTRDRDEDTLIQAELAKAGLMDESRLPAYQKIETARGNDLMYGLDSGAAGIAAGATATLTVTPQKRHIPQRIVLSQNVANGFVVTDIRAGVEPILATVGAISAAVFIQDATTPPFRAVVMEVGMDFSITVTNVGGAVARFTCTVIGRYLPAPMCG